MGFRPEPTVYSLSFQGTPLDGLHVRAGCCTLGEYNQMLAAGTGAPGSDSDDMEARVKNVEIMIQNNEWIITLFLKYLVSWDLEDLSGQPVPTTRTGLDSQERSLIAMVIAAWQTALVTIPNLSSAESPSGGTSEEQQLGLGS
jgi:hypothetical protein